MSLLFNAFARALLIGANEDGAQTQLEFIEGTFQRRSLAEAIRQGRSLQEELAELCSAWDCRCWAAAALASLWTCSLLAIDEIDMTMRGPRHKAGLLSC